MQEQSNETAFTRETRTDVGNFRCYTALGFPKRRSWSRLAPVIPQQRTRKREKGSVRGRHRCHCSTKRRQQIRWAGQDFDDPKSRVDLVLCTGQCHVLGAEESGGIYRVHKTFPSHLPCIRSCSRLHPLHRGKTQQTHAVGNDMSCGIIQSHTSVL